MPDLGFLGATAHPSPSNVWSDRLAATVDPRYVNTGAVFTAVNQARGARVRVARTGTLRDLALVVTAQSGNMILAIYDVGQASGAVRTKLGSDSGSLAVPAVGGQTILQTVWDPQLPVVQNQVLEFWLAVDNTTAAFGRFGPLSGSLPLAHASSFYGNVVSGAVPAVCSSINLGSFAFPATISGAAASTYIPLIVGRVA